MPLFVNVAYAFLPLKNQQEKKQASKYWEIIEQVSRILYAILVCFLLSDKELDFSSLWFYGAILCLILYHVVWMRYFFRGRDASLLSTKFLYIPYPLVIFPVLYYICCAAWLDNSLAIAAMLIFLVAHCEVARQTL